MKLYESIQKIAVPHVGVIEAEKLSTKVLNGESITLVNIICPGYKKRREMGVEQFDFMALDTEVKNCPNVLLMIEKMNELVELLKKHKAHFNVELILADVAILNFRQLTKVQNVTESMNTFYESIKNAHLFDENLVQLVKMSKLGNQFSHIPRQGITVSKEIFEFNAVKRDIVEKAQEYSAQLVFARANAVRTSLNGKMNKDELLVEAQKEVARFVREYGLAGQGVAALYNNPVILFTEPSGLPRSYFYHAYLEKSERMPVVSII